jgi:hypothetical protein
VWPPSRRSAPCWIGPPRPSRTGRLHAKALTDYQEGKISLAEARQRWDQTTLVGLAGADRFDKQPEVYTKTATTCK